MTTRRMMIDVLIALVPALVMAVVVFRWYAVVQVGHLRAGLPGRRGRVLPDARQAVADRRLLGRGDRA